MELSAAESAVIESIMAGDKAWSKVADLVKSGHSPETIADLMLGDRAMIEQWDHPLDGETVTLTKWGAYVWPILKDETLELAERPATVTRPRRKSRLPLTNQEREKRDAERCLTSRVPFWVEGHRGDVPKERRGRLKEYRDPLPELVPDPRKPEFLVDDVSGREIELFTQLFDGTRVQGIKIKVDRRLKGAKGKSKGKGAKGKAKQPKRRKAG